MPRQARLDARPHRLSARDGGLGKGDEKMLGSGDFVCPVKCLPRSIRRPFNWGLCLSISLG